MKNNRLTKMLLASAIIGGIGMDNLLPSKEEPYVKTKEDYDRIEKARLKRERKAKRNK